MCIWVYAFGIARTIRCYLQIKPFWSLELQLLLFSLYENVCTFGTSVGMLAWTISKTVVLLSPPEHGKHDPNPAEYGTKPWQVGLGAAFMLYCFVALGFSVLLTEGVLKRQLNFLLAYLSYGIVAVIIVFPSTLAACFLIPMESEYAHINLAVLTVAVFAYYIIVLVMVWLLYRRYEKESQFDHQILEESNMDANHTPPIA